MAIITTMIGKKIYAYKLSLMGVKKIDIANELGVSVRSVYNWLEDIKNEQEFAGRDDMTVARQELKDMVPDALNVFTDTLKSKHGQREKIDVATKVLQTHNIVGRDNNVVTNVVVDSSERQDRMRLGLEKFGVKINDVKDSQVEIEKNKVKPRENRLSAEDYAKEIGGNYVGDGGEWTMDDDGDEE